MRMNVDNYRCILSKSGLNDAEVCKRTGLTEKSLIYILDNGFWRFQHWKESLMRYMFQ